MTASFDTYLIDPYTMTITTVKFTGDYGCIYPLINAETYDMARLNEHGDGICVDDEGLFRENQRFFMFDGYPNPLAGKGMVLGCNLADGETCAPTITLEELTEKVKFVMPVRVNGDLMMLDTQGKFHSLENA